jgi:hypothetical protein
MIWSMYIYSRIKLFNHSKNFLECIPLLFATICLILGDINFEMFPNRIQTIILKSLPEKETGTVENTDNDSIKDYQLKETKNEIIYDTLSKKVKDNIEKSRIIEIKDLIMRNINKEKSFIEEGNYFMTTTTSIKGLNLTNENKILEISKIFNQLYENYLKFNHFDERIFLMEKNNSDSSPMKLTPYKYKKSNSFDYPLSCGVIKKPNAFRSLFGVKENTNSSNIMNLNMNLSSYNNTNNLNNNFGNTNLKETPQKISSYLDSLTPCSRVIYMDKWVKDYITGWNGELLLNYNKIIVNSDSGLGENNKNLINELISQIFPKFSQMLTKNKTSIVTSFKDIQTLCEKIIYKLLIREETKFKKDFVGKLLYNENFIKSAIVLSMEIVLFIENIEEIVFYKLAEEAKLDLYDFWKIINPFLLFDLYIPKPIRTHFCEIEFQLLSFIIWKKPSLKFKNELEAFLQDGINNSNNYEIFSKEGKDIISDIREVENIEFNNQSLFVYQ